MPQSQPSDSPRRVLINRLNSCSGEECSSLYFLSGILDIVSIDLRFIQPKEQEDFETVFSHASFTEAAYSFVAPFSEVEFHLSSQTSESSSSNIGGSYVFDEVTNGSAIIVASEFPGREIWMFSDRSIASRCSGSESSAVVFGNALNDGSHLFTMNPDGSCEKLEMDSEATTPLTYCQNLDNFTWEVYKDYSCSTDAIASETVRGSLGTVYCVVVGENVTSAEIICLSADSALFEEMRDIKDQQDDRLPLYLRTYMQIIGGSTAGSIFIVVVLIYIGHAASTPAIKFREGDIVAYRLSTSQRFYLQQKKKGGIASSKRVKNKGFAIIVRAAPPASSPSKTLSLFSMERWSWGRQKNTMKKGILQLQPLKRVIRSTDAEKRERDDLFSSSFASHKGTVEAAGGSVVGLKSIHSLKGVEDVELTVDHKERPQSTNWWGVRGGRVIAVFPNSTRRKIRLPPPPPRPASEGVSSKQSAGNLAGSRAKRELGMIAYLDNVSTQQLLTPGRPSGLVRRRRNGMENRFVVESPREDDDESDHDNGARRPSCLGRFCGRNADTSKEVREIKRSASRGIGWGGEEDMFLLYDDDDFFPEEEDQDSTLLEDQGELEPFLRRISKSKSTVGRKESSQENAPVVLQEAYSYVLTDLPEKIGGEKLNRIFFRDWVYPYAQEEKQAESKRNQKKKLLQEQQRSMMQQQPHVENHEEKPDTDNTGSPIAQDPQLLSGKLPPVDDSPHETSRPSFRGRSASRAESLLQQLQEQHGDDADNTSSRRTSHALTARHRQSSAIEGVGYQSDMPRVPVRRTSTLPTSSHSSSRTPRSSRPSEQPPSFTAPRRMQGSTSNKPPSLYGESGTHHTSKSASRGRVSRPDADREVQVGPNTMGVVMAGSKLERDDDDDEEGARVRRPKPKRAKARSTSRGASSGSDSKKKKAAGLSSPRTPRLTVLPPVASSPSRQTPTAGDRIVVGDMHRDNDKMSTELDYGVIKHSSPQKLDGVTSPLGDVKTNVKTAQQDVALEMSAGGITDDGAILPAVIQDGNASTVGHQ